MDNLSWAAGLRALPSNSRQEPQVPRPPPSLRAVLSGYTVQCAHAHCTLSLFNPPRSGTEGQGNSVPLWGLGQSPNVSRLPRAPRPFYFSIGSRPKGVSVCAFNRFNSFKKNDPKKTRWRKAKKKFLREQLPPFCGNNYPPFAGITTPLFQKILRGRKCRFAHMAARFHAGTTTPHFSKQQSRGKSARSGRGI